MTANEKRLHRDAGLILKAAFEAAHAGNAVRRYLRRTRNVLQVGGVRYDLRNFDRLFLLGVGKASVAMAAAVADIVGPELQGGLVVTKHGHGGKLPKGLRLVESAHPVPDGAGAQAASDVIALLRELNARDLLIVAVSGGASALLPAPVPPITLRSKREDDRLAAESRSRYLSNSMPSESTLFSQGRSIRGTSVPGNRGQSAVVGRHWRSFGRHRIRIDCARHFDL